MRTRLFKQWIAALLALSLLAGCGTKHTPTPAPSSTAAPVSVAAPTGTPVPTQEPAAEVFAPAEEIPFPDGVHADVDYADMAWTLYDLTEFNAMAERLASSKDEGEARRLYDRLLTEYARLRTLDELAWIDFYAYGAEADAEACQVTDDLLTEAGDTLHAAIFQALHGGVSEDFSAYVGEKTRDALADYQEMTDREIELLRRETELVLEYNELRAREDLSAPSLEYRAGKIFLELVSIRNEIAEFNGYETFADYAYEVYYGRDFTPADAAALCEQVKPYARRYYENCCYCGAFYADMGGADEKTPEDLMSMLREYAPRISGRAAEAQRYMEDHGLCLMSRDIADLGFTTTLPLYNAPFLFNSLYGSVYDIQSAFHEFGHYYDAYVNVPDNVLTDKGSFDIFEIHSTGLEALSYGWYDEIFGERAEEARIWCLDGLMYNIVSGCIYDEFQRYVYAHPDLTPDEVNAVFIRILREYGRDVSDRREAQEWVYVSHNFESPFYFISYAASALASVQLWSRSQVDRDAAIALYNRLVGEGAYDQGYCELLGNLGLAVFTDGLELCLSDFYESFEEMCLRYDGRLRTAA